MTEHHHRVALGSLVVLAIVGLVAFERLVPEHGSSTPVTVDDATLAFRGPTTAPGASGASPTSSAGTASGALPAPGVYVYATTGRDSVDALDGDHHDYPATTTITVRTTACGVTQRWDVLEERWEEWSRCSAGDGIAEVERTSFDRFFGQGQTDVSTCTGGARPVDAAAGTSWVATCARGGVTDTYAGRVVGTEALLVGGTSIETLHVRVVRTGPVADDSSSVDSWYQLGTDLLVAQRGASATSNASVIGTVHYVEAYEIRLGSLQPTR